MTHTCGKPQGGRLRREPYTGPVTLPSPPSHQAIARLAYEYFEARGRIDGFHELDWHQAERELKRRSNAVTWW